MTDGVVAFGTLTLFLVEKHAMLFLITFDLGCLVIGIAVATNLEDKCVFFLSQRPLQDMKPDYLPLVSTLSTSPSTIL